MNEFPTIDKAFIIDNSSYSSYVKGLDYYNRGNVKSLNISDEGVIGVLVEGAKVYHVELYFNEGKFSAACDCPYDLDDYCKHIAAALIHLMQNNERIKAEFKKISKIRSAPDDLYDKKIDKYLDRVEKEKTIKKPLAEYFKKFPESFKEFQAYYDGVYSFKDSADGSRGGALYYQKRVEITFGEIRDAFNGSEFYKLRNYMSQRSGRVSAGGISVDNYGSGESRDFFQKSVDSILDAFYNKAERSLKIGDVCGAASFLFAVYNFAQDFNKKFIKSSVEDKIYKTLEGAVKYHLNKAFSALIEIALSENFDKDDAKWFYNGLLAIYFSSKTSDDRRLGNFDRLKLISSRYGSIEYMLDFINENLINNSDPETGCPPYITAQNAHEAFYLLNISGETGRAVKIAEKYWQLNIILHSEYIEFLMKNFEHKKALKLAVAILKIFDKNPEKIREGLKCGTYNELKEALSAAVKSVDEVLTSLINFAESKQKKATCLKDLYRALYTETVYNNNMNLTDKLINVIDEIEKLNAQGGAITLADEKISIESFCEALVNEDVCDNLFKAKIFKKLSRIDLVINMAIKAADDYMFSSICCLIMNDRPEETFELFKNRIDTIVRNGGDRDNYGHVTRLVNVMARIPSRSKEMKLYLEKLNEKRLFTKRIL